MSIRAAYTAVIAVIFAYIGKFNKTAQIDAFAVILLSRLTRLFIEIILFSLIPGII